MRISESKSYCSRCQEEGAEKIWFWEDKQNYKCTLTGWMNVAYIGMQPRTYEGSYLTALKSKDVIYPTISWT